MAKVIASTYEIIEEIGSGGGGVVYLGRHLRLNKLIVLKADKRSLSAKEDALRREVDALKKLNHTYIPTVYDFVQEDGVVYTVMDYIEGESLDKPLSRGERFSQPQIVEWACELLEALTYLHSRPPYGILHSDIKPANIMIAKEREAPEERRPKDGILRGDIRLIDFNIALALGEEGAVRVGRSLGYASPEHYGQDFSGQKGTDRFGSGRTGQTGRTGRTRRTARTRTAGAGGGTGTELLDSSVRRSSSVSDAGASGSSRSVMLDVRSDIYSLGATLYHLLTGERPARDVREVRPIASFTDRGISPAVAAIITKSMDPDPEQRYQTAAEMLWAFEHLHEADRRTRRRHRRIALTAVVTSLILATGGGLTYVGLRQMERLQNAYVLAEYSADALQAGDVDRAVDLALQALPEGRGILDPPCTPQAQKALTDALGAYDLSSGYKAYRRIDLSAGAENAGKPAKARLSPDGTKAVVLWNQENVWWFLVYDTESGEQIVRLPARTSVLSDFVFRDDDTLIYAGKDGLTAYDLEADRVLWGPKEIATTLSLSGDGLQVAVVDRDEDTAYIYDAVTGALIRPVSFGTGPSGEARHMRVDPNDVYVDRGGRLFSMDETGHYLAVSFDDGGARLFDLWNTDNDDTGMSILEQSDYTQIEGGFSTKYFALSVYGSPGSEYAIFDLETLATVKDGAETRPYHIQADGAGILVSLGRTVSEIGLPGGEEIPAAFTNGPDVTSFLRTDAGTLVLTGEGRYLLFDRSARLIDISKEGERIDLMSMAGGYLLTASRDAPALILRKMEAHDDAVVLSYDPSYAHIEARLHSDRDTAMLFGRSGFRIIGEGGQIYAHMDLPDQEEIYDQQYRRGEGEEHLEVLYNDGMVRCWSAKTGELIAERQEDPPDREQYLEEFTTESFYVSHPLHGTATLYDRASGDRIRELETDDDLAYVTQVGDGLIAEYYTTARERYGLLLDQDGQVLARLPALCDILADGTLVFDDRTWGDLRQSRLYSIDELVGLAKQAKEMGQA